MLGQMLGGSNSTASAGGTGSSAPGNSAATTVDHGPAPSTAGGLALPNVSSGILDGAPSVHAPLTVESFSPPALDLQGSNMALPPVQALDQVRANVSLEALGTTQEGAAVPLALPEPSPFVLLVLASGVYLGADLRRRRGHAPAS
jgi:hypothetical protein